MSPPTLTTLPANPPQRPRAPQLNSIRFKGREPDSARINSEAEKVDSFTRLVKTVPAAVDLQYNKVKSGAVKGDFDPNLKNQAGETLLMHAVAKNDVQGVRALIQAGADVNLKNEAHQGLSALLLGILAGSDDAVDVLLRTPNLNINTVDNEKSSALAYAAGAGQNKLLEKLLEKGADPNQADNEGTTPLALTCQNGNFQGAYALLNAGAKADQADHKGDTPLLVAVACGNFLIAQLLLDADANPNHQNQEGFSPLSAAISKKHRFLSNLLLWKGADINRVDAFGQTLLTRLSKRATLSHVDFILSLGADVNRPDADGVTPLRHAISARRPEVVERLLNQPDLAEWPDIQWALLSLRGQYDPAPETLKTLAHTLASPLIAEPLERNSGISLANLLRGLRKTSQKLRSSELIQRFKRENPNDYRQACQSILAGLEDGEVSVENVFSTLGDYARQAPGTPSGQRIPTVSHFRSGHPVFNGVSINAITVQRNLANRLRELGDFRPDCRDQIRLDTLHHLFESNETIERLRATDGSAYLLACEAFLGLTTAFFQAVEDDPALLNGWSEDDVERTYRREVTQTLERGWLSNRFDSGILAFLLLRPTDQ